VESELGNGRVSIAGGTIEYEEPEPAFFKNRVNDGSDLSISEAVELTGSKWTKEGTVASAEQFMTRTLSDIVNRTAVTTSRRKPQGSPTTVVNAISTTITSNNLQSHLDALSLDDAETCVAKVTPERIYSVTCHPSPHHIIACAGDKKGHVGVWNVDQYNPNVSANTTAEEGRENAMKSTNDGVHLFKPHSGAVSSMIWNASGTTLLSASYDGSVRAFDASKQVFEEIFATYDDDEQYKNKIGYNLDNGYKSWVQCMVGKEFGCFILCCSHCITSLTNFTSLSYPDINQELDHRYGSDGKCFFLSTSEGSVMHVDLRSNGKLTFDQTLSEKKINSVRYVSISFQCLTLTRISVSRISVYFLFLINLAVFTPTVM
jgi:WD40 repeat protein